MLAWLKSKSRLEILAGGAWAVGFLLVAIRVAVDPHSHNVYRVFAKASHDWVAGRDIYTNPIPSDPYRYSPLSAALLAPLSILPDRIAAIVWRLIGTGAYLMALSRWNRRGIPEPMNREYQLWMMLLVFPMSIESVSNGQSNELILALLLVTITCAALARWYLMALCAALAASFKIYPLSIGLLIAASYPLETIPALLIALVGVALVPFGLQNPAYVLRQYQSWLPLLRINPATHYPFDIDGRDLRYLLKCWSISVSPRVYLATQVASAVAIASWCVKARLTGQRNRVLLLYLLAFGSLWMVLLGPATEQSTYILLAPSLAYFLLDSSTKPGHRALKAILFLSYGLFLAQDFAGLLSHYYFSAITRSGLQPLAALLMAIALVGKLLSVTPPDYQTL